MVDGRAVGYIRVQSPRQDVAYVVHDPKAISITGAFVDPEWRQQGVARLILGRVVDWARGCGFERQSVDFEAANALGSQFWLAHFSPVCHTLLRRIDERVLSAGPAAPPPIAGEGL